MQPRLFLPPLSSACSLESWNGGVVVILCLFLSPQLRLFAIRHQGGDPVEELPLGRSSHKQRRRRLHQQAQQRDAPWSMEMTEETGRDNLETETQTREGGLGSLGRLMLHPVASFAASTFIASLDVL